MAGILAGRPPGKLPLEILVAESSEGRLVGYVEVGLRSHAEGCDETREADYLEGWFVLEGHRRKGIGGGLPRAAESWARSQGCTEMASDASLANEDSQRAHEALGFLLAGRSVNYRKAL